ncbi:hypothetical protein G6F66_015561 [Rhizopus arrhizus]|nr:hypothetical protein G6F66_015561 [Rhizopus arrhizus]
MQRRPAPAAAAGCARPGGSPRRLHHGFPSLRSPRRRTAPCSSRWPLPAPGPGSAPPRRDSHPAPSTRWSAC